MKKLIIIFAGILMSGAVHAQSVEGIKEGSNTVRLLLGASQSAFSGGVAYERRSGTFGVGGFLLSSTKDSDANKPETLTFGLDVTSHLIDKNDLDVYISPGIAVTNSDAATSAGDDDTLFGPTLKIGTVYSLNHGWGVGLEYLRVFNWFSEKSPAQIDFANLVVSYSF
ncbi:outer membrane beta-barrel protein [Bdellovibrio sp. NC01]|uniref:outer membrane beta-barrel protein n=1 Tax=Bdellovibrio sp. NC01 TaxID=2220073 RepID=UPI00115AE7AC|nr:outer membrane beta-barrel protein [Bdellovibrio sp. NC01]QDK36358.1 hypothetical protein DOE51_01455 [Bdellovibrio sp. NC01]